RRATGCLTAIASALSDARMRQTIFILSCALFAVAGCSDDTTTVANNGADMSVNAAADMTLGPDMTPRVPNGVACDTTTCAVGQSCCLTTANNAVTGGMCVASASACTSGSNLACDGPEDCSTASPTCCATLSLSGSLTDADAGAPMLNGGNATCAGTCSFTAAADFSSITTRLCHYNSDCAGLTVPYLGTPTSCCSSSMVPGVHFCAVALAGITCP
ncbi:MAG TPA: hypothetical protein VIA18_04400, partial [Polyangia bacterium]|nr:hypothetical protein [Polyangia bacterium]